MEFTQSNIYNNVFVSKNGEVKKDKRLLIPLDNKVQINKERIHVCKLVVDTFIKSLEEIQKEGLFIWHIDTNKANNSIDNLKLVTQKELNKLQYENRTKPFSFRVKLKHYSKQFRKDVDNFIKNYDPTKSKE